jgi:hypothetical protein
MAMTIQERRRRDRDKKRKQRAAQRAAGAPQHHAVLKALVEATAFAWDGVNIERPAHEPGRTSIDMAVVIKTASTILVDRCGFNAKKSAEAIKGALAPHPEHRWPGNTPTHADPAPAAAQAS